VVTGIVQAAAAVPPRLVAELPCMGAGQTGYALGHHRYLLPQRCHACAVVIALAVVAAANPASPASAVPADAAADAAAVAGDTAANTAVAIGRSCGYAVLGGFCRTGHIILLLLRV